MSLADHHLDMAADHDGTDAALAAADGARLRTPRHPQGVSILLLAAAPLMLWLLRGDGASLLAGALCLALYVCALWLLSEGLNAEDSYNARRNAARPPVPRKILGSILLGVTVTFIAASKGDMMVSPLILGILASALSVLSFGIDPLRDKGVVAPAGRKSSGAEKRDPAHPSGDVSLDVGEQVLAAVLKRVNALGDAELTAAAEDFYDETRFVLRHLRKADDLRREMSPEIHRMLKDIAALTDAFVPAYHAKRSEKAKHDFIDGVADIQSRFDAAADAFLPDRHDYHELDIDGLMDRMARETAE